MHHALARAAVTLGLVAAVLSVTSCASRGRSSAAARLAAADALAAAGCHRCLTDALAGYDALASARGRPPRHLATQMFRTALLLAMREKELGLEATPSLDRARTLVSLVAAPERARDQLRWADLLPWNGAGLPRNADEAQRARLLSARAAIAARLTRPPEPTLDPLDVYVDVSLACAASMDPTAPKAAALAAPALASPIVTWRLGICGRDQEARLAALLERDPRYVEAEYWLGRYRLAAVGDPSTRLAVRRHLDAAHAAFPSSAAIAIDLASVVRTSSFRDALPLYDRVIAAVPAHNDAWFGRGLCLSYLRRHPDAIDAWTRVLALGRWHVGDAYYWRAWNRHQLRELDAAWTDAQEAKKTLYNTDVYGLSGIIAYDQGRLDLARVDLEKALTISAANCAAAWYLGLVHTTQERWTAGGEAFEGAERCYRAEVEIARAQRLAAEAADEPAEVKAARVADAEATIRDGERQAAMSAYNAGFGFVRAGTRDRARPLLDRAATHPDMTVRARELLGSLDR